MSETKAARFTLELITNCMHELARELGAMDPDDPRKATVAAKLFSANAAQAIQSLGNASTICW